MARSDRDPRDGGAVEGSRSREGAVEPWRGATAAQFRFGGEKRKVWTGPTCKASDPPVRMLTEENAAVR
jgi:hypothetical protein